MLSNVMAGQKVTVKGQDIVQVRTLGSRYDNNSVLVIMADGKQLHMRCKDLLPLFDGKMFEVQKARTNYYIKEEEEE